MTALAGRPRRLRAGRLEATWDAGGLRWITFDGVEVLRGILLTARDPNWRSLPPVIRGLRIATEPRAFSIGFDVRFQGDHVDVGGTVAIEGDQNGSIHVRVDVRAATETVVQRLGLVVLHPASVAGRPYEARQSSGTARGEFPVLVTADRFMTEIRAIHWEPIDGLRASLTFDGDPWETEDHRAWTDASFKSYSPPLSRPHPVTVAEGSTVTTALHLAVERRAPSSGSTPARRRPAAARVTIRDETTGPLPPIGLGWSGALEPSEAVRLHELGPAHLRVVLDATRDDWRSELDVAAGDARAVGTSLHVEAVAFDNPSARRELADALGALRVPCVGVLAFGTRHDAGLVTSEASNVGQLRRQLRAVVPGLVVGGGSRANYAELAGAPVPVETLDTVAFAVTPQIHATDAATIVENLATLPVLTLSASALGGGRPLDVLCTFRPRFDAYADPPERRLSPSRFDDRLAADLGVAWLIGTLAGVVSGKVARVTIVEAAGPAGVLGSAGLVSAMASVLAMAGGDVLNVETTEGCAALALRSDDRVRVIVANLRDRVTPVRVTLPAGWRARDSVENGRLEIGPLAIRVFDADPA